ncbi:hydroxyethylthiazole kinase [Cutibacterium sp. WCA-380-WT-3A]|uniref:Hydroxyethylthiazole kinase n=1 Tax=Cutibacterium porci TaxID=2605781 RepID=A0A7K0J4J8_9ACTN|nr:hydroxyethylthiazole kinase [Cutibacterium porci]MSS44768.1 hydroxyethylthiazole kinase [Cutibacterium porci]
MTVREVVAAVRGRAPMVHCLTATVSMSLVADGLLAAGLRPMMTETLEEAPVVVTAADALSVNLGTLSTDGMTGIPATIDARPDGIPWVLDPTAIGLAPVRTRMAREFLDASPNVVKGNASEILALVGGHGGRGADSADGPEDAVDAAIEVARRTGGVVVVSGATDVVVTADGVAERVARGHPMMAQVTGTGCLLGALTAGCLVAVDDPVEAAVAAVTWFDVSGEVAAARASGPGSFRVQLLDALDEVARTGIEKTR